MRFIPKFTFKKCYNDPWEYNAVVSYFFHHNVLEPIFKRIFDYGRPLNKHEFLVTAQNYITLLKDAQDENPTLGDTISKIGTKWRLV